MYIREKDRNRWGKKRPKVTTVSLRQKLERKVTYINNKIIYKRKFENKNKKNNKKRRK